MKSSRSLFILRCRSDHESLWKSEHNQEDTFWPFPDQLFESFFSFVMMVFGFSTDIPKVAFAVSLGGNGLQKTTSGSKTLIYKDILTNIGQAYNSETGK